MALNCLPAMVLRVAPACDHEAGLRKNSAAIRTVPATLSLPGRFVPGFSVAVMEPRPAWAFTDDLGTAQAVVRAGRPRSFAGMPGTANLGRNPRGMHQSRWSQAFRMASMPRCYYGKAMAYVQG
jgi:hypothetical protein